MNAYFHALAGLWIWAGISSTLESYGLLKNRAGEPIPQTTKSFFLGIAYMSIGCFLMGGPY